jgi:Na+-translocating ferredoxin:NAD+ oxidoreductase RNF subunit RnfB
VKKVHVVNQDECIGCSVCFEKCPVDAIEMR